MTQEFTPIKRDWIGRYLFPDPVTGEERAFTRVTTLAKALDDTFFLDQWTGRRLALGFAVRPDLVAQASMTPEEDKKTLNAIVKEAMNTLPSPARIGTAIHAATEMADRGEPYNLVEEYRADVRSYIVARDAWGLTPVPEYIEAVLVVNSIGVAGTTDRFMRVSEATIAKMDLGVAKLNEKRAKAHARGGIGWGTTELPLASEVLVPGDLVVVDVKTGKSIEFGAGSMPIQFACYANADKILAEDGTLIDAPDVNLDYGLVAHVPAGTGETHIAITDIREGWEGAQLAARVLKWQESSDVRSQNRLGKGTGSVKGSRFYADEAQPLPDLIAEVTTREEAIALHMAEKNRWTDVDTKLVQKRLAELAKT